MGTRALTGVICGITGVPVAAPIILKMPTSAGPRAAHRLSVVEDALTALTRDDLGAAPLAKELRRSTLTSQIGFLLLPMCYLISPVVLKPQKRNAANSLS